VNFEVSATIGQERCGRFNFFRNPSQTCNNARFTFSTPQTPLLKCTPLEGDTVQESRIYVRPA